MCVCAYVCMRCHTRLQTLRLRRDTSHSHFYITFLRTYICNTWVVIVLSCDAALAVSLPLLNIDV